MHTHPRCIYTHLSVQAVRCWQEVAHYLFTLPMDYLQRHPGFRKTDQVPWGYSGELLLFLFTWRPWPGKANRWIASSLARWLPVEFHQREASGEAPRDEEVRSMCSVWGSFHVVVYQGLVAFLHLKGQLLFWATSFIALSLSSGNQSLFWSLLWLAPCVSLSLVNFLDTHYCLCT